MTTIKKIFEKTQLIFLSTLMCGCNIASNHSKMCDFNRDSSNYVNYSDSELLLTDYGPPSSNLGRNGDSYIDFDSWNYYKKNNGEWVLIGNLKGEIETTVQDGASIVSIFLSSRDVYSETYTIVYSNGETSTFTVARQSDNVEGASKIRIGTYNVGRWNYGLSPSGYFGDDLEQKIYNYKELFTKTEADIFCIQENAIYFDRNQSINSKSVLFDPLYKYNNVTYEYDYNASIFSKYVTKHNCSGVIDTETDCRQYAISEININGIILNVLSVHLPLTIEDRMEYIKKLLIICDKLENVIICGDWNVESVDEYSVLSNAGYKVLNGGYLKYENTYANSERPIDNIVVSKNIYVSNLWVEDFFEKGVSDHLPLICDIIVY